MKFDWVKFLQFQTIVQPLWETIYMVFISTIIALIIGLPIGILLTISDTKGVKPNKTLHKILDIVIVNVTRSIPFIILIVLLIKKLFVNYCLNIHLEALRLLYRFH